MEHTSAYCPHFLGFWGTSRADCGVGDMNPQVHHPGIPSLPVYTSTRWILGYFIDVYNRDFFREHCLTWLRDCWSSQSGGAPDFSNSSKSWAKPTTCYMRLYHDLVWVPPGVVCHLEASVGSTAPLKGRRVLNDPKGLLAADFDQIPVLIILDVIVRTAFFWFVGDATQVGLVRTAFFAWTMQHRWVLLPDEGSPDVAANPVFMEFASNGGILGRKKWLIAPFRAQGRCLTQK